MSSWNSIFVFLFLIILTASCGSNNELNKKKDLSFYLVELGDRKYSIGEYQEALKYYDHSIKHNKEFHKNIYIISRVVKTAIKLGKQKGTIQLIQSFKLSNLKTAFEKEIYHYTLGKYFIFLGNVDKAKIEFDKANQISGMKRTEFYKCLIAKKDNCQKGITPQ